MKKVDCTFPGSDPPDISDDDVFEAMKSIGGFLDITPGDFKQVYRVAFRHAIERLRSSTMAKDIMIRNVIYVSKRSSLIEVAEKMAKNGISGLPVVDNDEKILGMISEKDILFLMGSKDVRSFMDLITQCFQQNGCVAIAISEKSAEDIMTTPVITVSEDTPVSEIADILRVNNINRVPVIDSKSRIAGIVTRTDIVGSTCAKT